MLTCLKAELAHLIPAHSVFSGVVTQLLVFARGLRHVQKLTDISDQCLSISIDNVSHGWVVSFHS